MQNSIYKIK